MVVGGRSEGAVIGDNLDISGSLPVERSEPPPSYTFAKHALFVPTLLIFTFDFCVFLEGLFMRGSLGIDWVIDLVS